ncbi:mastermind 1-like protein [Plakobranchus ocellatus]|uniref:Mastermind 1-like protein n=1 Tax=Plakobranchus ocellatus TaxID=259542 RepID=A0AAV3YWI1_9GAST|nr:mastermind 1-like protein [Plakobranchus ocellatus]
MVKAEGPMHLKEDASVAQWPERAKVTTDPDPLSQNPKISPGTTPEKKDLCSEDSSVSNPKQAYFPKHRAPSAPRRPTLHPAVTILHSSITNTSSITINHHHHHHPHQTQPPATGGLWGSMGDFCPKKKDVVDKIKRRFGLFRQHHQEAQERYMSAAPAIYERQKQESLVLRQRWEESKARKAAKQPKSSRGGGGGGGGDAGGGGTVNLHGTNGSNTDHRNLVVSVSRLHFHYPECFNRSS